MFLASAVGCSASSKQPGGQPEICQRYLACAAIATPDALPVLQANLGPNTLCWTSGPDAARDCERSCASGLSSLRLIADSPMCGCRASEECMDAGRSVCDATTGHCVACLRHGDCPVGRICRYNGDYKTSLGVPECLPCSNSWCTPGYRSCLNAADPMAPRCVECMDDVDCQSGATCDRSSHRCQPPQSVTCLEVAVCLLTPNDCRGESNCCHRDKSRIGEEFYQCVRDRCLSECLGLRNPDNPLVLPACKTCLEAACQQTFTACLS